jgi:hypothetical protein
VGRIILNFNEATYNNVKKIISNLIAYGNTRQDDLTSFGAKTFQLSKKEVKDLIRTMAAYGLVEEVVHNMLEKTVVYFKKGSLVPIDMELAAIGGSGDLLKIDMNNAEGVRVILDQVALISTLKSEDRSASVEQ